MSPPTLRPLALALAALCAAARLACIGPPAPAPRRAAPTAPPATPPSARPAAPADPAPAAAPLDPALAAAVRAWLDRTEAAAPFRGGPLDAAPEFDTTQVRCARVVAREAPDPLRAARLVCVAREGGQVLAGEPGLQRHLQMHQFDPALAAPAARVLLELRDAMLGFAGRIYTNVDAHAAGDALVIDARGAAKPNVNVVPAPARWRVTIARDGTTREEPLPPG